MVDRDSLLLLREVESTFRSRGVIVNGDWLSQCLDHVLCRYPASASSVVGVSEKAFQIFLCSDLYLSKGLDPVLPTNLLQRHKEVILRDQVIVVQVDEAVDISSSLLPPSEDNIPSLPPQDEEEGEQEGGKRRRRRGNLYKCLLTDGFQQVVALDLDAVLASSDYQPGGKVSIGPEVEVRRGALLLRRSQLRLLGGGVPRLQALAEGEKTVQSETTTQAVPLPPPPPPLPSLLPQLPLLPPPSQTTLPPPPPPSVSTLTATGLPPPIRSPLTASSHQTSSIAPMPIEVDVDISWDEVEWIQQEPEIPQPKPLQPHRQQEANKIIEVVEVEEEEWGERGKKVLGEQHEKGKDLMEEEEEDLPIIAKGKTGLLLSEGEEEEEEEEGENELNVWDFSTSSPLAPHSTSPPISTSVSTSLLASTSVAVPAHVPSVILRPPSSSTPPVSSSSSSSSLRTFQQILTGVCLQGAVRCFASRLLHCSPQAVVLLLDDGESLEAASLSIALSQQFLDRISSSSPSGAKEKVKVSLMSREGMMCFQRFSGIFLCQRNTIEMTEGGGGGQGEKASSSLVISDIIALHGHVDLVESKIDATSSIADLCRAMLAEHNMRNDNDITASITTTINSSSSSSSSSRSIYIR